MKRYTALILCALSVFSLCFGCQSTGQKGQPTYRYDITVAEVKDVTTFDPHKTTDEYSQRAFSYIYDSLLYQNPDLEIEPALAESWEYTSDTEIVFHLRQGVKFHNGAEMTADDVVYSLERVISEPAVKASFWAVDGVEKVDDMTVKVKLNTPYTDILWSLASPSASILCKDNEDNGETPVGTGSMKMEEWQKNKSVKYVRNDEYWKGTPKTESITVNVVPESTMRMGNLKSGYADFVSEVPPSALSGIENHKRVKIESYFEDKVTFLSLNGKKEPFDNLLVRQAISCAIDKEALVQVVLEGRGKTANTVLAETALGYSDTEYYSYDVDKAIELMEKAGYPEGFSAEIYVYGDDDSRTAQLIQSDLAKISITLDISVVETATILDYANSGVYDMCILTAGNPGSTDGSIYNLFHSSSSSYSGNRSFFADSAADELLDRARTEKDETARAELYIEAQDIIMEQAAVVPFFTRERIYGINKNLEGYVISKTGRPELWNAAAAE